MSHIASVAVFSGMSPLLDGWLPGIVLSVAPKVRAELADAVFRALIDPSLTEENRRERWDSWIRKYVSDRTKGQPCPMDGAEAPKMAKWAIVSPDLLEGMTSFLRQFPRPDADSSLPLSPWLENQADVLQTNPVAAAELILYYLSSMPRLHSFACQELNDLISNIWEDLPQQRRRDLREQLARLGCPD